MVPRKVVLTSGVGKHKYKLMSFELALRDAGVEKFNLVKVSSIIPPNCELASKEALAELKPGQIVYCVMSKKTSNEAGKKIFASVAAAFPKERGTTGYITEDSGYGSKEESKAKEMAVEMLAKDCEVFEAKEDATVEEYTTVVALAVFIP